MTVEDIPEVYTIEVHSFTAPWKKESFVYEILHNQYSHYFLIEEDGQPVGYCGVWIVKDDAQITNIAILPEHRGKGYGEALLRYVMEFCKEKKTDHLSLEVRVSNTPAQSLYEKLGFKPASIRKNYYTDNGEDALVMWVKINE
ncbi:ribosomal protein S18-alanine N-acetyltransferase [Bacillus altitudinis]|uniref:ribosomal protein S18-alanine N-acetyltransferase n=1 Tax=Bacillus altitudinis TaxID=293387 RepID=UPI00057FE9C6|nr:ribosomal protein S18-alanine N-acetyltransferase [Bacillus altitudinis]KWZ65141.1 ribosomal-protein-alanine acetyltransferase [Bacillus altitudinis]